MLIKYAGIIAISCAISVFGAIKSAEVRQINEIRKEVLRFLRHVETGIKYGSASLLEIFYSFKSEIFEKKLFSDIVNQTTPDKIYIENKLSELTQEERSKLSEFFKTSGKAYSRDEEIKLCNYYISVFEAFYEENKRNNKSKEILYKKLGIICALLAAILLI